MAGSANHSRLTSITYPSGYVLTFNYSSGLNSNSAALVALRYGGTLESYDYLGLDTVVIRGHSQPGVDLTYVGTPADAGDQYAGLDRFGRVVDQCWKTSSDHDRPLPVRLRPRLESHLSRQPRQFELRRTLQLRRPEPAHQLRPRHAQRHEGRPDRLGEPIAKLGLRRSGQLRHANHGRHDADANREQAERDHEHHRRDDADLRRQRQHDRRRDRPAVRLRRLEPARDVKDSGGATLATYGYDGLNRRVQETVSSTTTDVYFSSAWQVSGRRQSAATPVELLRLEPGLHRRPDRPRPRHGRQRHARRTALRACRTRTSTSPAWWTQGGTVARAVCVRPIWRSRT